MSKDAHKSRVQSRFGETAGDYAISDVHAAGESLKMLIQLVQPQGQWQMLDVATGAGHTAHLLAQHVLWVIAADLTEAMLVKTLEIAERKGIDNLECRLADAEALPFDDASFDLLTCRLAFHHFQKPRQALSEFARVLRPGALLGFTDNFTVEDPAAAQYYNKYETIRDPAHHWVAPLSQLEQMIVEAGIEIRESRKLSKEFEFHNWADRQRVNDEDKERLLTLMHEIPEQLEPLFQPRFTADTLYFSLREVVIVAIKQ